MATYYNLPDPQISKAKSWVAPEKYEQVVYNHISDGALICNVGR